MGCTGKNCEKIAGKICISFPNFPIFFLKMGELLDHFEKKWENILKKFP